MALLTQLQQPSWAEYLRRFAGPTLVALCIVSLVRDPNLRTLLKHLIIAFFIAAFAAKEIADFPATLRRALREHRSERRPLIFLLSLLAPELAGWIRTLGNLIVGFLSWGARRRPPTDRTEGLRITYLQRSGYGVLIPLAILVLLTDVPVSMLLLPALGVPEVHHVALRAAILFVGLTNLACLLGDRWHISARHHVLTKDKLLLRIGVRFDATIPLSAIQDVRLVGRSERICVAWSKRELLASPFDRPNVKISLTDSSDVKITSLGCAFNDASSVYLYVDDPESLLVHLRGEA